MKTVDEIMDMLDWNLPNDVQKNGIEAANELKDISPFLQPLTARHNKNVWDNCAKIISQRNDLELRNTLIQLFQWIQDMNWPGAEIIFCRLKSFRDSGSFNYAFEACLKHAKETHDTIWYDNLFKLKQYREIETLSQVN